MSANDEIDPRRYSEMPPGAVAKCVGEIVHGLEGAWLPCALSIDGRYWPAVVPVEPGSLVVVDRAVPWTDPNVALGAAEVLAARMADA